MGNLSNLKKNVIVYILTAIFLVVSVVLFFTYINANIIQKKKNIFYTEQVNSTIGHIIGHAVKDYIYITRRIVGSTNMAELLEHKDRDAMYRLLKPRFDSLQRESVHVDVMHVHLADGNSFLRVHKPKEYGDKISEKRDMLATIHKNHKAIYGYETGVHAFSYRALVPIFNKDAKYIGAFEIGLNPNFVVDTVHDINGFCGASFIKEEKLKLATFASDIVIDGYKYYPNSNKEVCLDFKKLKTLENNVEIELNDNMYLAHVLTLKDFNEEDSVKLVFFQNLSDSGYLLSTSTRILYLFTLGILLFLMFLIYYRLKLYENNVSIIYNKHIGKIKESEKKLVASTKQFELFMEYIPANIIIKDKNCRILFANKGTREFFKQEDMIGKTASDIVPPYLVETINHFDKLVLEKGVHEEIIDTLDEQNNRLYYRTLGFKIEHNNEIKIGIISVDIGKEKALNEELKSQEEIMIAQSRHAAMGEMISMIAHQWRQPISVIAMDVNNVLVDLELDTLNNEKLFDTLKDIIFQTQELSKTIDDFRGFFKPNKDIEKVLLKDICADALSVMGKSLENNNIIISKNIDESIEINTFARELMQVLINIVKNAKEVLLERKIEDKKISIEFSKTKRSILLSICDNAGGVDKKIIDRVFEPYFTTKGEKNGTGLGLYMSKIIIEKHLKGTIRVLNSDGGACVNIELPYSLENLEVGLDNED